MPGHAKKVTGPDPDPSPWLSVGPDLLAKLKDKPYDAKKSCWVPDKSTGGFQEGLIQDKGLGQDKISVQLKYGEVSVFDNTISVFIQ